MASFVQSLRMRNMFPVQSDMGSARVDLSGQDPMYEIINAYNNQLRNERMNRPMSGLQQVAARGTTSRMSSPLDEPEPLKFGGVIGPQSNPGADILNRSAKRAEQTYANYGKPLNEQVKGPSNDEINLERYFKRKNEEVETQAKADALRQNADIRQQNIDSRGWETVNITDPANPDKQISARHNKITGETKPIELPNNGVITRRGSAADIQKRQDLENEKLRRRESVREGANSALELVKDLMDDKGNLTPEAERAVGKSSAGNWIPTTLGYSGSTKIDRLKNKQILDLIGEMKSQSKTGATGFGAMNLRELDVLSKAASMLDTGLDSETFRQELKRIKDLLIKASTDIEMGATKTFPNGKRGRWDAETSQWELIEG